MLLLCYYYSIDSFLPQGVNRDKSGIVSIDSENDSAFVEFFDDFVNLKYTTYLQDKRGYGKLCGSFKYSTRNEYIVEFREGKFVIEKIGAFVNHLNVQAVDDAYLCLFEINSVI